MEIKAAITHYCKYQERCHSEVRNKLYELGCRKEEVEQYISELIEQDILNEERYARAIARGKFRMKQWGKQKIVQQLRFNKISIYCINKGLSEIDDEEYTSILEKLALKKWHEFRTEKNVSVRRSKVHKYLLQKGYENTLIYDTVNKIINGEG